MTNEQITVFLSEFDGYFKERSVLQNKRAASVWIKFLAPIDATVGNALLDAIIFNCHFPPSPKQAQELLAEIVGIDFKKELKQAIAAYSSADARLIREVPREISQAIIAAGGANKFRNATEQQWEKLEKEYISIRTETVQKVQLTALAGGKNIALEASK